MSSDPDPESPSYSLAEVRQAIEGLTDADFKRLMTYAMGYCAKRIRGTVVAPEDLLQDALIQTLSPGKRGSSGTRRWRKGIPFDQHIDQAMRSISSEHARKAASRPVFRLLPDAEEDEVAASSQSVARHLESAEERALSMFEENPVAREIVLLRADGVSVSEIQLELGISKADYESTCRWIRRRRAEFLKQGDA